MRETTEETRERIERVRRAIEEGADPAVLDAEMAELHPADLAEIIDHLEGDEKTAFFGPWSPFTIASSARYMVPLRQPACGRNNGHGGCPAIAAMRSRAACEAAALHPRTD